MKNSVLVFFFLFTLETVLSFAQTVSVNTFGVSPRDVARDTSEHYFDIAYNGLQNVGKGVKVYLKGSSTFALAGTGWSFVSKPAGSNANFGTTKDLDTSNQVVNFIPDLVGNYEIKFTDGALEATLFISAGEYIGLGADASCKNCHGPLPADDPGIYNKWTGTGHSRALEDGLNGVLSSHFSANCLPCHTTGFIPSATNGGFDDYPFVFPTVLQPGMYDSLTLVYPQAMNLANVQCESCHGPGSGHVNNPFDPERPMKTLSVDNCALCHNSGTHYVIPEQWKYSGDDVTEVTGFGFDGGHAKGTFVTDADRNGCSPCHSGSGYVQWIHEGRPVTSVGLPAATLVRPPATNITCAVCHDPHDATNLHQLRALTTQLADSTQITSDLYGTGTQCMDCHRARVNAVAYTSVVLGNAHFGPHHGPQADMLLGKNAPDFGIVFPSSPHAVAGGNSCNDCHMTGPALDVNNNVLLVGGHSWNMNDAEGHDNVAACSSCHGDIGTSFADKKYYINGNADLDGNGVAEGLQIEVEGLMANLSSYLPHDPNDSTAVLINTPNYEGMELTPAIMKAGYTYIWIEEDRSLGVHNPAFTVSLLKASIEIMGGVTSIDYPTNTTIPEEYQLSQNYPNPFNPTTTINFSIPDQSNVKIIIYDVLGKQVDIITDEVKSAGSYSVKWNASNYASGIYFYKLEADNFVQVRKMILIK